MKFFHLSVRRVNEPKALEKNWLERGSQPKKNEGKGGGGGDSDEKIRLKIG